MNHHLFKNSPSLEILFQLLRDICPNGEEYFIVDTIAYKKMLFANKQEHFLNNLLPCYHKSKQHYVTRDFTYNSFVNIIRQICIYHKHSFVANKKYNHSVYDIRYIIDRPK